MSQPQDVAALIARSKTLINNVLKRICKEEGKTQVGNKAQLQARVIEILTDAANRRDFVTIERMRYRLFNQGQPPPAGHNASAASAHYDPYGGPATNGNYQATPGGYQASHNAYAASRPTGVVAGALGGPIKFKPSPFYDILEILLTPIGLEASPSHRKSLSRNLELSASVADRMRADPKLRLMLFGSLDQPLSVYSMHDVAFPSQFEVKINGDVVSANWKGLKNKPGSTRPADVTQYVRKTPARYRNTVEVMYALTQKVDGKVSLRKYNLCVYLARKHAVDELAKRIIQRNVITKQSVIDELRRKANDPDIEIGSINMGLKDPVSTMRISIPCRSTVCSHLQCFDAESFLQLQEQAPTWTCPHCSKTISYESLAVDQYFQEILEKVPKGTDQVTIKPDTGEWTYEGAGGDQTPQTSGVNGKRDMSEDDLIDVTDSRVTAIKSEVLPTPSLYGTPSQSSREPSSAPRTGTKRKSEVIDLTLSDDDEPPRPAKKVNYSTPNSLPDPPVHYEPPAPGYGSTSMPMRHPSLMSGSQSQVPYRGMSHTPTNASNPPPPYRNYTDPNQTRSYDSLASYGSYRQPPPPTPPVARQNYPHQGTAGYPQYLGSSP